MIAAVNPVQPEPEVILYTNHRGETSPRRIRLDLTAHGNEVVGFGFGSTEWHPGEQLLFSAFDVDKGVRRTFAMAGVKAWGQAQVDAALAAQAGHRVIEAADTPGSIGPGDLALTIAWPDGTETVEHVSEQAAAVLGYRYADAEADAAPLLPVQSEAELQAFVEDGVEQTRAFVAECDALEADAVLRPEASHG